MQYCIENIYDDDDFFYYYYIFFKKQKRNIFAYKCSKNHLFKFMHIQSLKSYSCFHQKIFISNMLVICLSKIESSWKNWIYYSCRFNEILEFFVSCCCSCFISICNNPPFFIQLNKYWNCFKFFSFILVFDSR